MPTKLSKELLGLAGEYAVASELCKRRLYAQLTLGRHKHTDILVETERVMMRISVKAKQSKEWPAVQGLNRPDDFLVLVDLKGKGDTDRPDFYILDANDWKRLVFEERERRPAITLDTEGRITYPDGWKGLNITPQMIADSKEEWCKITSASPADQRDES